MYWLNNPKEYNVIDENGEIEGSGGDYDISNDGNELKLFAPAKKDYWSKTFYNPLLIKSDASALVCKIPIENEATIKIDLYYNPMTQFDQGGLLVYIDHDHWVKAGIEFCDGTPRLSVVVCNGFSDWSTQP